MEDDENNLMRFLDEPDIVVKTHDEKDVYRIKNSWLYNGLKAAKALSLFLLVYGLVFDGAIIYLVAGIAAFFVSDYLSDREIDKRQEKRFETLEKRIRKN